MPLAGFANPVTAPPQNRFFPSAGAFGSHRKTPPAINVSQLPSEAAKRRYWKKNLTWLGGLLAVWFIASFGCGVLLVDVLDRFHVPGSPMKLGFWIAQQGSIYVFIILIAVYAAVMNRLDRELLEGSGSAEGRDS